MICNNCHRNIPDGLPVCPNCGTPIGQNQPINQQNMANNQGVNQQNMYNNQPMNQPNMANNQPMGYSNSAPAIPVDREKIKLWGFSVSTFLVSLVMLIVGRQVSLSLLVILGVMLLIAKVESKPLTKNFFTIFINEIIFDIAFLCIEKVSGFFTDIFNAIGKACSYDALETLNSVSSVFSKIFTTCSDVVGIVSLVFFIMGIVSLMKGDEIRIPIASKIVDKHVN